jgi:hypothetical protein
MMKTATNPETGERFVLVNGQWQPMQTATNPETNEQFGLIDSQWQQLSSSEPVPGASNPLARQQEMAANRNSPLGIAQSVVEGITNPIYGLSQVAYNAANEFAPGIVDGIEAADSWLYDNTGGVLGSPSGDVNQQIADRADMMELNTGYSPDELNPVELVSEVAPYLLAGGPAMNAAKGLLAPSNVAKLGGAGAAGGASIPIEDADENYWAKVGTNSAVGAGMGMALPSLASAATNKLLKNVVSPEMDTLRQMGVTPSLGQQIGGAVNDLEQKMTSIPIMGGAINSVRESAKDSWRNATVQRALDPVDAKIVGASGDMQGAMADSFDAVSAAYTSALDDIGGFRLSNRTNHDLERLYENVKKGALTDDEVSAFTRFWDGNITPRIKDGGITAQTYKKLDSELSTAIANQKNSEVKGAFLEAKDILSRQVADEFPDAAGQIKAANEAYANLVRVNKAVGSSLGRDGNFGAGQLSTAIRSADKSAQKKAATTGTAPMSEEARAGRRLMDTVPNSGTADRSLTALGVLGATGLASASIGPEALTAALPYLIAGGVSTAMSTPLAQQGLSKGLRAAANVATSNRNPAFHLGVLADELGDEEDDWFYGRLIER